MLEVIGNPDFADISGINICIITEPTSGVQLGNVGFQFTIF